MRILHINKFFDMRGGVEAYLHQLMEKQAASGHDVHVLSTRASTNMASPDAKYFIHRYDFSRTEGLKKDAAKAVAFLWNSEARRSTERVLREVRPNVIHLHNIYHHFSASILAPIRSSGIPCVQTLHDLKLACPNYSMFTEGAVCERCKGGRYWNAVLHHCVFPRASGNALAAAEMAFTKMTKAYERTVRKFICPSRFLADKMREWGEPASKFTVLPNPCDLSPQAAAGGGGYILFTGRLTAQKGIETVIRALPGTPTLPLRIAGAGPDEERLRHIVRSLNLPHVSFHGFALPHELRNLRNGAEAVVVPSAGYENSPLALLEAMSEGVPVVASRIGGIPELLEDGKEGFLVSPGSVQEWISALRRLQGMTPSERLRMGEAGRERIRAKHGWKEHLEGLEDIYKKAA